MTKEVFGSKPEFGSSQNKYLGLSTMERAIPTLFCIPPEISPGYLLLLPPRATTSIISSTRSCFSFLVFLVNISKGKRIFSSTVIESNKAEPWNNIPMSFLKSMSCLLLKVVIFVSSYQISPSVGFIKLTKSLRKTVLPAPLRPMMRLVLPFSKVVEIPFSTSTSSNDFLIFTARIKIQNIKSTTKQ